MSSGVGCPICDFPMLVRPTQVGTVVKCPACGKDSEIAQGTSNSSVSMCGLAAGAVALGAIALSFFVFTKARKSNIRVR